jgi:anti-sigma B factor antagonist
MGLFLARGLSPARPHGRAGVGTPLAHLPPSRRPYTMSFDVDPLSSDTVVVHMGEALDFRNADEFKDTFQDHVEDGVQNFILDFSETEVLDSTGLGSIFSLYREISPEDGKVAFADVSRPVQVVVQLTRTYKVFRQFPSVQAAQEALA